MSNSSENRLESPLVQVDLSRITVAPSVLSVKEHAFQGHVILRGLSSDERFVQAVQSVLGADLPLDPNTMTSNNALSVLWYGPSEWLIITPQDSEFGLIDKLKLALEGTFSSVTDISGGNTILDVSGVKARELLEKGTPFDLHESVFNLGQCAQTVLAKANMTIFPYSKEPAYKLVIRRSFSDYLGAWLIDAAEEYS